MTVALVLSGQPRSVVETFPFIRDNIIRPNNPDVFIHSWIDDSIKGKTPIAACGDIASSPIPDNIEDIILALYNPVNYEFEPQREFDEKNYNERKAQFIKPKNSLSQRYSIRRAFALVDEIEMRSNFFYDAVIRMRFDWAIETPIDVSTLPLDKITLPNDCPHAGGYNDQFAIGNSFNMDEYANLYWNIDQLYNDGVPFIDEVLLGKWLEINEIGVNSIHIPYHLMRERYQAVKHSADYI